MWLAASARASGPASSSTAGLPPAVTPVFLGLFVSVIFIAQHLRIQFGHAYLRIAGLTWISHTAASFRR